MKTIVAMFWAVIGGVFLAISLIVITQIIGAGANLLGFTVWTYRYYMVCLCVSLVLLILSKPARKFWPYMGLFFVAVSMVMAIGFQSFMDVSSGQGQLDQMQANLQAMGMTVAKIMMYAAPGALTAFYGFVAFDGVKNVKV